MTGAGISFSVEPLDVLGALEADWKALQRGKMSSPPFGFFELQAVRAELLKSDRRKDVRLLLGRDGSQLVAAALLGVRSHPVFGRLGLLSETGDPALDTVYTEYNDLMGVADQPDLCHAALKALFADDDLSLDGISLTRVGPEVAAAFSDAGVQLGLRMTQTRRQAAFAADLTAAATLDNLVGALGKSTKSRVRRSIRLYEEGGQLRLIEAETPVARAQAFDALLTLHRQQWAEREVASSFLAPTMQTFHRALIERASEETALVSFMQGSTRLGVLYYLTAGNQVFYYQSGFAAAPDNQHLPGYTAHLLAMVHFASKGYRRYNLMSEHGEYKARIAKIEEPLISLTLDRPNWRTALRRGERSLRRHVKSKMGRVSS